MSTYVWYSTFWKMIEIVLLQYPNNPNEKQKIAMYQFFESLKELIPCNSCKDHYKFFIKFYPVNVNTHQNVENWVNALKKSIGENKQKLSNSNERFNLMKRKLIGDKPVKKKLNRSKKLNKSNKSNKSISRRQKNIILSKRGFKPPCLLC